MERVAAGTSAVPVPVVVLAPMVPLEPLGPTEPTEPMVPMVPNSAQRSKLPTWPR